MLPLAASGPEPEMKAEGCGDALLSSRTMAEIKAIRSHSEAERRRRQRINGHLATLRSLLPSATRLDKAALLAEVVRHVRELKGRADDVAVEVPGEGDEVGVEEGEGRVRAWVCCDDRPGLMGELSRAVGSVQARAVRVEMVTIAGRTRSLMELEMVEMEKAKARSALQAALQAVLLANRPGESYKRVRLPSRFSKT